MPSRCVVCDNIVRWNQHSLPCQVCAQRTHRICGTGLTADRYKDIVRTNENYNFTCSICAETTPVVEISATTETDTVGRTVAGATFNLNPPSSLNTTAPDVSNLDLEDGDEDVLECSVEDSVLRYPQVLPPRPKTYTLVDAGSQKGKTKLIDTNGYCYVVSKSRDKKTYWRCSVRNKNVTCGATVTQTTDTFLDGKQCHCHPPEAGQLAMVKVRVEIKEQAVKEVFKSANSIVQAAHLKHMHLGEPGGHQSQDTLIRMANRTRQALRPKKTSNTAFEIADDSLPDGLLRRDVQFQDQRHLVMASDTQISHLSKCRNWFLHGTAKVVSDPFYQLLSINGYMRSGSNMNMLPMVFVLMSRRKIREYVRVFERRSWTSYPRFHSFRQSSWISSLVCGRPCRGRSLRHAFVDVSSFSPRLFGESVSRV